MAEDRLVEVEFLEEDFREIGGLLGTGRPGDERLHILLSTGLEQFQRDEASWEALRDRDDPQAEVEKQELKRRETQALLISMRSRTLHSEMRVHNLTTRVQSLQAAYADRIQRTEAVRRSIAGLRRRIAGLEAALGGDPPRPEARAASIGARFLRFLRRRDG